MKHAKSSISRRLTAAGIAIRNASEDPDISVLLGAYGYDAAKLAEGQTILDAAVSAVQRQVATAGGWQAATSGLMGVRDQAYAAYRGLAEVARAALGRTNPILASLGLNRRAPRAQALFLTMATALFDNVIADAVLTDALTRYGYTPNRLAEEKAKVTVMADALQARESAKGAAQQATMDQRAALASLDGWMSAFRRVARVALRGQEQLLEKLGILARNAKTAAQRQGPIKAAQTRKARRLALAVVPPKEVAEANAA